MKKLTYLFFCLSMAAFSFDTNNDLNMGIPISEKTSANKTYENPENNNLPPTADAGEDGDICYGDSYQIGVPGDQSLFIYSWTSFPQDPNFDDDIPNPIVSPVVTTTYTLTVTDITNDETAEDSVIVTVNPLPDVDAGPDSVICESDGFYQISDASITPPDYTSLEWSTSGTGFFDNPNSLNPTYSPSPSDVDYGLVTLILNVTTVCGNITDSLTLNITEGDNLSLISAAGTDAQVLCEFEPINDIIYQFSGGATSANIYGLPAGVTFTIIGDLVTISGTPTADMTTTQVYPYTITTQGGNCLAVSLDGMITVNPEAGLVLTSPGGTDAQILCQNTPINDITYVLVDGATGATVTGLPAGVSLNVASGIVTISGTPTDDLTTQTIYTYTITTTGSPCSGSATGTITIDPDNRLNLISGAGTDAQVLCLGYDLIPIVYEFNGGATSAIVTGLPAGVTFTIFGDLVTISGTPLTPIAVQCVWPYTITTLGGNCLDASLDGTISFDPDNDLDLISAVGTDAQVLCETDPLVNINYEFSGCATSATVTGLPLGVTSSIVGNVLTISGTPTGNITTTEVYPYTITTIGTCADTSLSGTITVFPEPDISAGDDEVICESETITLTNAFASNYSSLQWTTSGDGFFVNGGITLVPTYVPGPLDIYGGQEIILTLTVYPIAPCQNVITDSMVLTFVQEPIVDVGPDMTISQGAAVNLNGNVTNASSVLWTFTGGSGTLVNENTLSAVYISDPAEEGPIILTLTAQSDCGEVSDSLIININPTPDEELWFLDSNGTGIYRPTNTASGDYSIASGYQSEASGDYSTAMGLGASAAGNLSTAMGSNSAASGDYTTAIGTGNSATGDYSISIGNDNTTAEGEFSLAMGIGTLASGNYSTTMGYYTTASGIYSTSMGEGTTASGEGSTATGLGSIANGGYSTAMGANTTASGFASTALGQDTTASGTYSTAMGINTTATQQGSVAMGADTVADGQEASAFGRATLASGAISTAMGLGTTASANYSTATGYNTTASGVASTAMGDNNTASGFASTSIGGGNTASGGWSTASGQGTTASANYTTAGGYNTTASGVASTVMGDNSTASGFASTAMGGETTASGDWSTSMGLLSVATGQFSTSMGVYTEANGNYSTATGRKTIASDYASTVIGQNNLTGATPTSATNFSLEAPAFVIGNGLDGNRSDAFSILFDGTTNIAGSVTATSFIGDGSQLTNLPNDNTDDQAISYDANTNIVSLEDGGTIDLSGLNNSGTDDQQLANFVLSQGSLLSLSIQDGNVVSVDLAPLLTDLENLVADLQIENQEQQALIDDLIIRMEIREECACDPTLGIGDNTLQPDKAYLLQNIPNPFDRTTSIGYFVPYTNAKAHIVISTMAGQIVHNIELSNLGVGAISIDSGRMAAAVYLYTLYVDGKRIDTKRMIVE